MADGIPNFSQARLAMDVQGLNQIKLDNRRDGAEGLRQAAEEFEALFINMMLKSMREAVGDSELFDSHQQRTMMSMYDEQLSRHMATRGIGLADQMVQQLQQTPISATAAPSTMTPEMTNEAKK
ncbi:rod-binding protein [Aliidiomarina indica]|uniref:rod-binding protein n=1 Tax=Aliidiomarina indica TaxID=2749147 RepID=UPI00188EFF1D|nr:rod-binding protein [Aliidiomarina indica]